MDEDRLADFFLIGSYLIIIIARILNWIDWGWEWILLPLWVPVVLCIVAIALCIIIGICVFTYNKIKRYVK